MIHIVLDAMRAAGTEMLRRRCSPPNFFCGICNKVGTTLEVSVWIDLLSGDTTDSAQDQFFCRGCADNEDPDNDGYHDTHDLIPLGG